MTGMGSKKATSSRSDVEGVNEVIVDLTDAARAQVAADDLVIDLRDHVLAAQGGAVVIPGQDRPTPSGRPLDLLDGLELVVVHEEDERWEKAERFVYDTYLAMGYCNESTRRRVEELQPWTGRSHFHIVLDEEQEVVGTARLIQDRYENLPIGQFSRTDHRDPDPVMELSSVVVAPTARGLSVVAYLCRSVFFTAFRSDANGLVFLLEEGLIRLLTNHYGLPVRYLGDTGYYMGGDVTPSGLSMAGREYLDTARANPYYWNWMLEACQPGEVVEWELPILLLDSPVPEPSIAHTGLRAGSDAS